MKRYLFLAVAAALVVPGCSSDAPSSTQPRTMADLRDAIASKAAELSRAKEQFVAGCMADRGFDYVARAPEPSHPVPEDAQYGFTASLRAARLPPPPSTDVPHEVDAQAATPEYATALTGSAEGDGTGGCRGAADAELGEVISPEVEAVLDAALGDLQRSPQFTEMIDGWRGCMLQTFPGREHTEPGDADAALTQEFFEQARRIGAVRDGEFDQPERIIAEIDDNAADQVIAALGGYEQRLFQRDRECAESNGIDGAMDDMLQVIVNELPDGFFDVVPAQSQRVPDTGA